MKLSFVALIFISAIAGAQTQRTSHCNLSGSAAVDAVMEYIFSNDPVYLEQNVVDEQGFIRLSVFPAWDDDVFYQIRLVYGPDEQKSTIVKYSIPRKAHSVGDLIKKALKSNPCATVRQIAMSLPLKRSTIALQREWRPLFDEVYQLNFRARPNSDQIWLDRTEYEVEYIGMNDVRLKSDDYDDPVVQWAIKVVNTIDPGK